MHSNPPPPSNAICPRPGVLDTTGAPRGFNSRSSSGGSPNLEEIDLDREIPNLVWSGIVQRRLWQPRGEASSLLGWAGKLPGGGDAGNGSGTMSRNVFKAEGRMIQ